MQENPNLFSSVGKPIKDEYGRQIGRVASFAVAPSGKFDSVYVESSDGKFTKHPVDHLKLEGGDITLTSKMKALAGSLCDQIPLLWRKDQALKELSEKKKIPKEMYTELHCSFDGALSQLKDEAQSLTDEIEVEIARCTEELKSLNYALVNLEIEHEIGKMDEQQYATAFQTIQDHIKRAYTERNDLELTKSKLSNILLGDTGKTLSEDVRPKASDSSKTLPSAPPSAPSLPEPPVVVYVKEVGRAAF